MPNDDLGQFPTPNTPSQTAADQPPQSPSEDTTLMEDINAPATDQISSEPFTTPPSVQPDSSPAFEETPEEIPSISGGQSMTMPTVEVTPQSSPEPQPEISQPTEYTAPPPSPEPIPASAPFSDTPATITPRGGSSFGSLITIILLMIAGVAIAATVFLFSQSKQLQQQLLEVTRTLEQQRTTVTPTPTPTIIEFTTPTPSPESTISATPTPSLTLTPTPTSTVSASTALPLANAAKALQVAINHQPNAQLILIKTENATNPQTAVTKYFFRQDLTTKKYFYVMMVNANEPEIVDTAIYVTPDNNIPSLNDLVLGSGLGSDLDQAIALAEGQCTSNLCATAAVKAQYIKVGENLIWQLTFDPQDAGKSDLIIQINALTKAVLYKSSGF